MLESYVGQMKYKKLTEEEKTSRHILGRLFGTIADFKNPTRNGRYYSESLWDKTFENPIMQEKIKNRCCFGELGHPADRTETDPEKIAICLDDFPKKNSSGQLIGVFDILDTPNGRILKTLCDYGCNIGVSSRGSGDTYYDDDGNEAVNPDTYECECWDAVLIPAVESARPQYVNESLSPRRLNNFKKALTESLDKATPEERKVMESTLKDLNIKLTEADNKEEETKVIGDDPDKDLLDISDQESEKVETEEEKEIIPDNIKNLEKILAKFDEDKSIFIKIGDSDIYTIDKIYQDDESGDILIYSDIEENTDNNSDNSLVDNEKEADNIGSEVITELQESLKENSTLKSKMQALQNKLAVSDTKGIKLEEELARYKSAVIKLSNQGVEKKELTKKVSLLEEELKVKSQEFDNQTKRIKKLLEARKSNIAENKIALNESFDKSKLLKEEYESKLEAAKKEIESLKENLKISQANSESKSKEFETKINKGNKILEKYRKITATTVERYIESKALSLGVKVQEIKNKLPQNYTVDDIDNICEDLQEYKINISKLPFNLQKNVKVKVTESKNDILNPSNGIDDDIDITLMRLANQN